MNRRRVAILLLPALVWAVSWRAPWGYVAWEGLRGLLGMAALARCLARWRRHPNLTRSVLMAVAAASLLPLGWAHRFGNGMCTDIPVETSSCGGWTCTLAERHCGATVSDQYRVTLVHGKGWTRRERLVLDSYRSPVPELLRFDATGLVLGLRSLEGGKLDTLRIVPEDFGRTWSYYRDELQR